MCVNVCALVCVCERECEQRKCDAVCVQNFECASHFVCVVLLIRFYDVTRSCVSRDSFIAVRVRKTL